MTIKEIENQIIEEFEVFDADFKPIEEDDPQLGFEVN